MKKFVQPVYKQLINNRLRGLIELCYTVVPDVVVIADLCFFFPVSRITVSCHGMLLNKKKEGSWS